MAKIIDDTTRPTIKDRLNKTVDGVQGSQAWSSIFRPGSIFRKGYTDSTIRWAPHRCMFLTSRPNVTDVCRLAMSFQAAVASGR